MRRWRPIIAAVLLLSSAPVAAHSFSAILVAGEFDNDRQVSWRLHLPLDSAGRAGRAHLPVPAGCQRESTISRREDDALIRTLRWSCTKPLGELNLQVAGLDVRNPEALISLRLPDGSAQLMAVNRDAPNFRLQADHPAPALRAYLPAGVRHILSGWDHLLFLLGLLMLVARGDGRLLPRAVLTVTAFTLAHSLTLSAAVLGALQLPGRAVEACIALSILLLAVELSRNPDHAGLSTRAPWAVAFGFGLLHGFGFAGALADMGLPAGQRLLALLSFNLGVELGQLTFVAAAVLLATLLHGMMTRLQPVGVAALGSLSAYWLIERSVAIVAGGA